jgi:multidrug efflux pump
VSQRSIGTGVIGGMLSATIIGVVFAPVFFVWVLGIARRFKRKKAKAPKKAAKPVESV